MKDPDKELQDLYFKLQQDLFSLLKENRIFDINLPKDAKNKITRIQMMLLVFLSITAETAVISECPKDVLVKMLSNKYDAVFDSLSLKLTPSLDPSTLN